MIFSYLSRLPADIPYHGNDPRKKYIKIYPKLSKSSLLLYSIPKWQLIEQNLGVPVNVFCSRYAI